MQKTEAVASLGQRRLMLPTWVKAALSANDRLKVYLTVLQAAAAHASHAERAVPDLSEEIGAAGLEGAWLHEVASVARRVDHAVLVPDMARIVQCLENDLVTMARPVLESTAAEAEPHARVARWLAWLRALPADRFSDDQMDQLTSASEVATTACICS